MSESGSALGAGDGAHALHSLDDSASISATRALGGLEPASAALASLVRALTALSASVAASERVRGTSASRTALRSAARTCP